MKPLFVLLVLLAGRSMAQPGLTGTYYAGTNFERKVATRADPELNFNWAMNSPAPGMPSSYYSIRWTGKILAPATGQYRFYAKVDDGIRIWVGSQKIMDSWQLNDSKNFTGNIVLEAGHYYDLRIDYFNDMLEGEIKLYWQRPDAKQTAPDPITAQFFFRKAPTVAAKVIKPLPTTPVIVAAPPKAIPKKPPVAVVTVRPKPVSALPPAPKPIISDSLNTASETIRQPASTPQPEIKPGVSFILRSVQFEQSSYTLLPESSAELDRLVMAMRNNPTWHLTIAGHTDNVGDPRLNLALSENRAKVVANYLKRRNITDDRITTVGYGGTRPIADNTTEGERGKNRRVEMFIR